MRTQLLFLTILFSGFVSKAQYAELGVLGGTSYYIGELNHQHFQPFKPAGGIIFRNNLGKRLAFRMHAFYGNIEGADANSKNEWEQERNLNFNSHVFELSGGFEINYFKYMMGRVVKERRGEYYTPYLFIGLSYYNFNPKTDYNGESFELQPLGTEGQGTSANNKKQYKLNQISIPLALGIKFNVSKWMSVGLEYGIRRTFTDYLDDVSGSYVDPELLRTENGSLSAALADRSTDNYSNKSFPGGQQRGNPNNRDWYSFSGVTLMFNLIGGGECESAFRSNKNWAK
jgi:opacity protein-like surface antigen